MCCSALSAVLTVLFRSPNSALTAQSRFWSGCYLIITFAAATSLSSSTLLAKINLFISSLPLTVSIVP